MNLKSTDDLIMTLEDFEKSLAEGKKEKDELQHEIEGGRRHRHHRHHREEAEGHRHRHKRRKHSEEREDGHHSYRGHRHSSDLRGRHSEDVDNLTKDAATLNPVDDNQQSQTSVPNEQLKRDSWMQAPSAFDIEYTQKGVRKPQQPTIPTTSKADFELKIHENELNKHHLQNLADSSEVPEELMSKPSRHEVNYLFGDAGAQWRMTKLKAIYARAEEEGKPVEDVALDHYGDLRTFDEAREEQTELDRRDTYGKDYVGKEKPNGDLHEARKLDMGLRNTQRQPDNVAQDHHNAPELMETQSPAAETVLLGQTELNRLKAQMLKAKARGASNASSLEAEYNVAMAAFAHQKEPDAVVLGAMENRMLTGSRGEVKSIDNKRGRIRGLVEENEDMSIEDMVREERRTRNQAGGDGRRFADRIAKDGKFVNDLEYMDENASKLAKRVQKSEVSLKNTAISDFQKKNRILDHCPLCHQEDTNTPPVAPVVSLATRVYLTLPTEPEIGDGGACIIPLQHRRNLLECDDDEWEEIRNFMKSLTRMYHDQGRDVIFYENAAAPHQEKHAGMQVVPLPYSLGETASAFFKEAILAADEEWTQHKKIIDTLAKARNELGKSAFRRSLAKEMPYFHVWLEIDGGLGHIVEDFNRWPKGDLFAREVIGGMLDKGVEVIKRQGKWTKGDRRVDGFRKRWEKFDWTRVLTDA